MTRIALFRDTVLRRLSGRIYLMNKPETGFRSGAVHVESEADCEARYAVKVGPWGEDKFGPCAPVTREPAPAPKGYPPRPCDHCRREHTGCNTWCDGCLAAGYY